MRRVSPSGDLNLSPGGLRVPARVRQSYHRFAEGLGLELVANLLQSCVRSGGTGCVGRPRTIYCELRIVIIFGGYGLEAEAVTVRAC